MSAMQRHLPVFHDVLGARVLVVGAGAVGTRKIEALLAGGARVTAVAAGFDRFAPALIEHCLGGYARKQLGIPLHDLLALGRRNPDGPAEDFNMAHLAIRGSGAVNGVSRLHGKVSRHLFGPLFPRWPVDEVPVGHVTNGVHMPSWDSAAADERRTEVCGRQVSGRSPALD